MKTFNSEYIICFVHVAVWAVIIGVPVLVPDPKHEPFVVNDYVRLLLMPVTMMMLFYSNYFFLIRRYLFVHRFGRFFLCNFALVLILMTGLHLLFHYVFPFDIPHHHHIEHSWHGNIRFFFGNSIGYILTIALAVAIKATENWYRAEAGRRELERHRTEAELQNLKSQLNPHFLFNTLNNIYSLIQIDSERAQQVVHDLSRLLRYVLYDSNKTFVPLNDEVEFIRNYIELMRIRLSRNVRLNVSLPDSHSHLQVAPLLFISLVENAFKHGVSNDKPSFISIDINEKQGELICDIENSLFPKSGIDDRSGSGIGLKNLSKRLDMIYYGRYVFTYGKKGDVYKVKLSIRL